MGKRNRRTNNFIVQGSILAIAGLIVRIIGLLYRVPMTNIIGDEGMGYYSFAFEPYSVMLLLSYHGLPTAVSKLVAARNGEGKFKNSYRVFQCAMIIAIVIGIITGAITYFGAGFIAGKLSNQPMSTYALKILGPTIFILSIMGILRGYFQGMGTMVPTAISQVMEAIVNAVISLVAASYLFQVGKNYDLVTNSRSHAEAYGAAGGTMGTCIGAIAGLIFLILVFMLYKNLLRKQMKKDKSRHKEDYADIARKLLWTSAPIILSSIIFNISTTFDGALFSNLMPIAAKMEEEEVAALWGVFTGKYKIMIMVPVAIATALATSIVPDFSEEMAAGKKGRIANKIQYSIRFTMIVAIPSAIGLSVLAKPILTLLFHNVSDIDVNLLRFGTIAVIFYSLSTITNAVLQGINLMKKPVTHATISLVLHLVILAFLIGVCKLHIYGVLISYIIFALIICVLNALTIQAKLSYKQEWIKTFLLPAISSTFMGGIVYGIYYLLYKTVKSNLFALLISILVGVIIYFVMLLLLKCIDENDLRRMPLGEKIIVVARILHLL